MRLLCKAVQALVGVMDASSPQAVSALWGVLGIQWSVCFVLTACSGTTATSAHSVTLPPPPPPPQTLPLLVRNVLCISRVPDQNGISWLYNMLEIHHSGPEPSICLEAYVWECVHVFAHVCVREREGESTRACVCACTYILASAFMHLCCLIAYLFGRRCSVCLRFMTLACLLFFQNQTHPQVRMDRVTATTCLLSCQLSYYVLLAVSCVDLFEFWGSFSGALSMGWFSDFSRQLSA